jgi:hypothetical protein
MASLRLGIFIGLALLLNIAVLLLHLSNTSNTSPKIFLRQQISQTSYQSQPIPVNSQRGGDWLQRLELALKNEVLLTRNVKSKAHLWTGIESSSHFHQESGEILVFLGWVAYWVRIDQFQFFISPKRRTWSCMHSMVNPVVNLSSSQI